jgi:hypothetical protein
VATGTVRLVVRRRAPETFVFVFGVAYLILMSTPPLHFSRNLVPLVPFAAIAGAEAGDLLIDSLIALVRRVAGSSSIPRLAAVTASVVLVAVMASNPLAIGLSASGELVKPDTRVVAYEWLENHLPTGTRVARDGYTPVLVAPRFDGELYWPLAQNGVAWYRSHGFAYLVLSDYVYLRVTPGDPLFADYSAMLSLPVVYRIGPDGGANGPTIVIVRL